MEKLTEPQIDAQLTSHPEWSETGGALQRTYQFPDFAGSVRFVNAVAEAAESADHHPDILVRYNKVTLTLSTHDAGGITQKDFDLAGRIDQIFGSSEEPVGGVGGGPRRGRKG